MTQRTSLRRLIHSLYRAAVEQRTEDITRLGKEATRLIKLKRERFLKRYGIDLTHWDETLEFSPEQIGDFMQSDDFRLLLTRDVEISYSMLTKFPLLYCPKISKEVEVAHSNGRLIFDNPLAHTSTRYSAIESWARASSKSREYTKHHHNSTAQKASKYHLEIDIENLEYALFERPIGILSEAQRVFLYATYEKDIGKLPNGKTTKHVAMQCDRETREKGTGFLTKIHSYPVSESEVKAAFQGARFLLERALGEALSAN